MRFYRCTANPKILFNELSEVVTLAHIQWIMKCLSKEFAKGGEFTTVNYLHDGVIFKNTASISKLSDFVTDNNKHYKESIYIGLSGFHKILLKMHISLMKSDMSRLVLNNLDELKEKRAISFPEDFELIASYDNA